MNKVRALSVDIYESKNGGNCSNNGISNRFRTAYIICPDGNWEFDLDDPENLPEKDILVQVTGAGELAGIDNGDLSDLTPYTANYRKTVDGKLVIYIKRMATGKINVAVREVIAEKSNVLAKINI